MHTDKLRSKFAEFLKESGIKDMIAIDGCITVDQDVNLKYERIDKFRVLFLNQNEIKDLMQFCEMHNIVMWFGADKLCIGYNYKGCQRLSAYDSVCRCELATEGLEDRNNSVSPEISAAASLGDRIKPDHHLDVHGGVD